MSAETEDYILILEAVAKLKRAMFATLSRTADVKKVKALLRSPKLSVVSGPHLEEAKKVIRKAAMEGRLAVYARTLENSSSAHRIPHESPSEKS